MIKESQARIIVVDDEQDFLDSVTRCLKVAGFTNFACLQDPLQALELFKDDAADLLLIDMIMPGMDGLELMQAVKELSPLTPCIIISGSPDADDAAESIDKGAFEYLQKPITPPQLVHSIRRALAAGQAQQPARK